MLMAALPPPPITVIGRPLAIAHLLSPPAVAVLVADFSLKSHRSRAPPLTA
jgi:hypothetical protein